MLVRLGPLGYPVTQKDYFLNPRLLNLRGFLVPQKFYLLSRSLNFSFQTEFKHIGPSAWSISYFSGLFLNWPHHPYPGLS